MLFKPLSTSWSGEGLTDPVVAKSRQALLFKIISATVISLPDTTQPTQVRRIVLQAYVITVVEVLQREISSQISITCFRQYVPYSNNYSQLVHQSIPII